jgi:ubiquitin carboxyl-terminal hydrolase 10
MSFTNAVLQLLVYCPPFRNLFSDLGRLTGQTRQRGQGKSQQRSGGTTLLVDATVRLLDEFAYKKEDGDTEPFTPMYVYDAMKEKRQLKSILVRSYAQVAPLCY